MRAGVLALGLVTFFSLCGSDQPTCLEGTHPYLSVVMAGRVDTFRGDFLSRAHKALVTWQALGTLHDIRTEIVVVEWNPLPGAVPLAEALRH